MLTTASFHWHEIIVSVTNNRIFPTPQCRNFSQCAIVIHKYIKLFALENSAKLTWPLCAVGRTFLCLVATRTLGAAKAGYTGYWSTKSVRDWFVAEYFGNFFSCLYYEYVILVCDSRDGVGHSSLRDAVSVHLYRVKRIVGWLPVISPRLLRRTRPGQTRTMGWQSMILPGAWIDPCLALVSFILFSIGRGLIIGRSLSEEPTNCSQIYIFSISLMRTKGLMRHIWKRRVWG
jgi:hypothetical protein